MSTRPCARGERYALRAIYEHEGDWLLGVAWRITGERGRDGGSSLTPAGETESVRGRPGDGHRGSAGVGHRGLRLLASGADLRAVADDLDGDVADLEAGLPHEPGRLGEQRQAAGPGKLGAVGAEVGAEVADPRGGEQRVARGMAGDVGIRVTLEGPLTGPGEPGDHAHPVGVVGQGVDVDADAGAGQRDHVRPAVRRRWRWARRTRPADASRRR